jgi:hypothetical protein
MSPHAPTPKTIADAFAALQDRLDAAQSALHDSELLQENFLIVLRAALETALHDGEILLENFAVVLRAALNRIETLTLENRALRQDIDLVTEREREGRERA